MENNRNSIISLVLYINMGLNLLLSSIKIVIGTFTNSIAIISEGINNLSDMITSILIIIGNKLSQKHPTKKHPFGFGRIEYLTSLLIGILILYTGIELIKSSFSLLLNPKELKTDYNSLIILIVSIFIKLIFSFYSIFNGKKANSKLLIAIGKDARSDSIISIATITSILIFLFFNYSIDAYIGLFTSIFVFKTAYEILKETISVLLGEPLDREFASKLYKIIRNNKIIINAIDMKLHNYGPNSYSGSVNVEVDHKLSVNDVYREIHQLQLDIMNQYNVIMVFGIYVVDNDLPELIDIRKNVVEFIKQNKHIISYHALYLSPNNELYCDFIVDYDLKDYDKVKKDYIEYMSKIYSQYKIILTIETEFV